MIIKNPKSNGFNLKTGVVLLCFLSGMLAVAPAQGAKFLQVIEREGPRTLFVQAQGAPLAEVLKEIANRSGIQFKIPESLVGESVTLNIEEHDWASVVRQVLIDYNSVYIWNGPTRLGHVFLMDSDDEPEISSLPLNTPREQKTSLQKTPKLTKKIYYRPDVAGEQNRITPKGLRSDLSKAQLKQLASGALSSPLSENLFEDRKIKKFLKQNGVKTIADGKKPSLAVKVRKQALKLYKAIKHAAMKNNF